MRHANSIPVLATLCTLAAVLATASFDFAADKPAPPVKPALPVKPAPPATIAPAKPDPVLEKIKALGEHLSRAFDLALDLFSNNQADLLSKNNTNLLSGNRPEVLNGNKTAVISQNTISGNSMSLFSNIKLFSDVKVEIHVDHLNVTSSEAARKQDKPVSVSSAAPSTTPNRKPNTAAPNPFQGYQGYAPGAGPYVAPPGAANPYMLNPIVPSTISPAPTREPAR